MLIHEKNRYKKISCYSPFKQSSGPCPKPSNSVLSSLRRKTELMDGGCFRHPPVVGLRQLIIQSVVWHDSSNSVLSTVKVSVTSFTQEPGTFLCGFIVVAIYKCQDPPHLNRPKFFRRFPTILDSVSCYIYIYMVRTQTFCIVYHYDIHQMQGSGIRAHVLGSTF